jgi:hypothetical protein
MADFNAVRITDATNLSFRADINATTNISHERPIGSTTVMGNKFPIHTKMGIANYWKGNFKNVMVEDGEECNEELFNELNGDINFANNIFVAEWLHNGLTKYIEFMPNWILPVTILESIGMDDIFEPMSGVSYAWEQVAEPITTIESGRLHCRVCDKIIPLNSVFCPFCGATV